MDRRVVFNDRLLPYLLLLPQLVITAIFFYWPAAQALRQSVQRQDAFGLRTEFVWFENFQDLFADPNWRDSAVTTLIFSTSVAFLAMAIALGLAVLADRDLRARGAWRTLLIWPYALAPAIAAVLWGFMFHPSIGLIAKALGSVGIVWDHKLNGPQALLLVILAAAWKQVSYNFIFFLAGLQAIPRSVLEAASIDGAGGSRKFWTIVFPLLAPTTFFLLAVNLVYAFFDTFGIIHALTQGGPGKATETLIYRAYLDGVVNLNLGASAAQSVVLMLLVIGLTALQFRALDRKVHY
jgi:sn-glycerol 3-phosphate transport system permease protein